MTLRSFSAAVLWILLSCFPVLGQTYYSPETVLSSTLDQSHVRQYFEWNVNGNLGAILNVSAAAGGTLTQSQGIRVCVCRPDRSVVAYKYVMVGETKTLTFSLSTGRYLVFFDLGVANPSESIGPVNFAASGQLTDLATSEPVHVINDLPPDPMNPPKSDIVLPTSGGLAGCDICPLLNGPPQSFLVFLHD